jgi:hypothetical protein
MYLTFVFYVAEDGHTVGRNMQQFIVCVCKLISIYVLVGICWYHDCL